MPVATQFATKADWQVVLNSLTGAEERNEMTDGEREISCEWGQILPGVLRVFNVVVYRSSESHPRRRPADIS